MNRISRVLSSLVLPAAAIVLSVTLPRNAEARPQYLESFNKTYESLNSLVENKRCLVCHGSGKKTERNNYGDAVSAALGDEKNVKEADVVVKALRQAEAAKSGVEGKTFGQLIESGKLPE